MSFISFLSVFKKKEVLPALARYHSWRPDPEWFNGNPPPKVAVIEYCTNCGCRASSFPPFYNRPYVERWIPDTAPVGQKQLVCPATCAEAIKLVLGESFNFDILKEYLRGL